MNIYLVRQDYSYLYGDILNSAVIIAHSPQEARKILSTELHNNDEPVVWDPTLWAITKIGNNGKQPPEPYSRVICKCFLNKDALPPGNYNQKKH